MKVLTDKFNNPNILTEESSSDSKEEGQDILGSEDNKQELCPDCHGSGSFADNTCSSCNGKGVI